MNDKAELLAQKKALRLQMNDVLRRMEPANALEWSRNAGREALSLPSYRNADIILAFLSMPQEISTGYFLAEALAAGKTVAVPRMEHSTEKGDHLVFVGLPGDYLEWPRDRFGIPTPPAGTPAIQETRLRSAKVFVLTPGLAFDRNGNRLGRGKGYYDRFLASLYSGQKTPPFTCGFCFSQQLVERVPCGLADVPVDLVVSEKGLTER